MSTLRREKVNRLLKKEISGIIHGELKDPRIGFVTVTQVETTPDLRQGKIYFSILGNDEDSKKTLKGLKSACGYIRKLIGRRLSLRYVPEFSFYLDKSTAYSIHINETIEKLKDRKDEADEKDN